MTLHPEQRSGEIHAGNTRNPNSRHPDDFDMSPFATSGWNTKRLGEKSTYLDGRLPWFIHLSEVADALAFETLRKDHEPSAERVTALLALAERAKP